MYFAEPQNSNDINWKSDDIALFT